MGGALRSIGRLVRQLGDGLADLPFTSLYWLGRSIQAFLFRNSSVSNTTAAITGIVFLILLAIVVIGVGRWLIESSAPSPSADGPGTPPPTQEGGGAWWEQ